MQQKVNQGLASKESGYNPPQTQVFSHMQNTYPVNQNNIFNNNHNDSDEFEEDLNMTGNDSEIILNQAVQRLHEDATRRKELKERI